MKQMRAGKCSELIVGGHLIRHGLDVYMPSVDDKAIDFIIRAQTGRSARYYDVQVKSIRGYNRIIGVKDPADKGSRYVLIIHYRHDKKEDEFFYLTRRQIDLHIIKNSTWGDLVFNRKERELYKKQNLPHLAEQILAGKL